MDQAVISAIESLLAKGPCRLEVTPTNGQYRTTMGARNSLNRTVFGSATSESFADSMTAALSDLDTKLGV